MREKNQIPPQGELYRESNGRWALNETTLTCGSCFQVQIKGQWISVTIEHDGREYYALPPSIRLHKGLVARFIGEYAE